MCKHIMNVYVNDDPAKTMTVDEVVWFHQAGIHFVVEGDQLPADVHAYNLPSGDQIIYTEESIGQDENGNEIFVPVEYDQ